MPNVRRCRNLKVNAIEGLTSSRLLPVGSWPSLSRSGFSVSLNGQPKPTVSRRLPGKSADGGGRCDFVHRAHYDRPVPNAMAVPSTIQFNLYRNGG
jgi:hypothetical protein